MPKNVEIPGVGVVEFPDTMSDEQISAAIRQNYPQKTAAETGRLGLGKTTIGPTTAGGRLGREVLSLLPMLGMGVGAAAGTTMGPLAPLAAPFTAGIGGGGGEALRQIIGKLALGAEPGTSAEAGESISEQAILGMGSEMLGPLVSKAGAPLAKFLRESGLRSVAKTLGPTTKPNKMITEELAPEMIDRRVMALTRKGLERKATKQATLAGERVGEKLNELYPAPQIVIRPQPDPKRLLTAGATRLPAPSGAYRAIVSPAEKIETGIVFIREPKTGQLEFFAKPSLGRGEYQRVLWGPDFTAAEREAAALNPIYGARPANAAEVEEMLQIQRGRVGPTRPPVGLEKEAAFKRAVAAGKVPAKADTRPLKGLSEFYEVKRGERFATKPLLDALDKYKTQFTPGGVVADPGAVRQVERIKKIVGEYGEEASGDSLIALRRLYDKQIAQAKGFQVTPKLASELSVKKELDDAIRREFAKKYPDFAKVNAEYHFWESVRGVIHETNLRTSSQAWPLGQQIATAAGAAAGVGAGSMVSGAWYALAFPALVMAIRSPGWRLASAQVKNELAKQIANGNFGAVSKITARIVGKPEP